MQDKNKPEQAKQRSQGDVGRTVNGVSGVRDIVDQTGAVVGTVVIAKFGALFPVSEALHTASDEAVCGHCKTCDHWTRYKEPGDLRDHGTHTGTCSSKHFIYSDESEPPIAGLRYWDYEGCLAKFDTGEAFGCVHWVKRLTSEPSPVTELEQ